MMPGIPAGRQLAASVSSGAAARYAFLFASDAGVSDGLDGGAAAAPREPGLTSHTPVKSGSFARAAQSAAVGALGVNFWARAISLDTPNSPQTRTMGAIAERCFVMSLLQFDKLARVDPYDRVGDRLLNV